MQWKATLGVACFCGVCQLDADAIALLAKATQNVNVFRDAFLVTLSDLAARHHALVTPSDLAAMQKVQG